MKQFKYSLTTAALLGMSLLLSGCSDDDDPIQMSSYEVTVTNLTYGQPLSPLAVVMHEEGNLWQVGESASNALEVLAEGGDNSDVLVLSVVDASASGDAPFGPGAQQQVMVTIPRHQVYYLSLATMLVNTNDAFTGLNAVDVTSLAVGDSWSSRAGVYDAGTEANTESMGTIPGPADGGTGYLAERDDVDFVSKHPGVVSQDDGLSSSVLTQAHRFDNPAIAVTITRTE